MKKQILLVLTLIIISKTLQAQCIPAIPNNAVVINAIDTINGGFDPVWVCPGDSFHTDGGLHNIYLEPGSFMSTGGGIDSIFVKKGATLQMNGGIHYILYEQSTDVILSGGIPTVDSCIGMHFNYVNAPYNGCFPHPIAFFQPTDLTPCAGSCINFTDMSFHAASWHWSFPGAQPASDTVQNPQNICYSTPGSYDVTLVISDSIGFGSDSITISNIVTVLALPPVTSNQFSNILSVDSGYSYQWYADTVLLAGEVNDTLIVQQNGVYHVLVTDTNGCDTTVSFNYASQGLYENYSSVAFSIFPNPANQFIRIILNPDLVKQQGYSDLEMTDALGNIVLSRNISNRYPEEIPVKNLARGIYFVRIISEGGSCIKKVLIQ
jgi:PKD repeat protein